MTKILLARVAANVILTFDNAPQVIYDATAVVPTSPTLSDEELLGLETDVIVQILNGAPTDAPFDEIVKISLCYNTQISDLANRRLVDVDPEAEAVVSERIDFLCRHSAKYYFQPNQRDDYEQAIVDRLGIASKTADFPGKAAA